ncbi:hypothetical protein [uncultured Catenibacterium sp.]|uniref:hypothetical protein n=1 Tax=uncultured Catenibacterium sp. TaxID=286142 RepID=UPI002632A919|nr:hypothetical protein [uncultured Catenibacterium sp.]
MNIIKRQCQKDDLKDVVSLFNEVIQTGLYLEQDSPMKEDDIESASYCGVMLDEHLLVGAYLINPLGTGHCKHIATCSYAIKADYKKELDSLIKDSLEQAFKAGYTIMQLNTVTKTLKTVLDTVGFKSLGMIRDGFKTQDGEYENTYVLYRSLDESILECKEKQDPMSIEISHISKKIQNRGIYWIVSEVKHYRIQTKREYSTFDYRDLHYQSEEDIKKFVENIFHKYYIENEKNHDTVHVLSVHTSKDDAVAEWIKRDDLELQKQMTSMHSFSKGVK